MPGTGIAPVIRHHICSSLSESNTSRRVGAAQKALIPDGDDRVLLWSIA